MMTPSQPATADLCDAHADVHVCAARLRDFGGVRAFCGPSRTLATLNDNTKLRALLETEGKGAVLVVDGEASHRCALLGGNLALLAHQNNWAGVVINGCVRDADELARVPVGIRALGTCPRKSAKHNAGRVDVPLSFGGVDIAPGAWVYADADGLVIAPLRLHAPPV